MAKHGCLLLRQTFDMARMRVRAEQDEDCFWLKQMNRTNSHSSPLFWASSIYFGVFVSWQLSVVRLKVFGVRWNQAMYKVASVASGEARRIGFQLDSSAWYTLLAIFIVCWLFFLCRKCLLTSRHLTPSTFLKPSCIH